MVSGDQLRVYKFHFVSQVSSFSTYFSSNFNSINARSFMLGFSWLKHRRLQLLMMMMMMKDELALAWR